MSLFGWFKRGTDRNNALGEWREAWTAAIDGTIDGTSDGDERLRTWLDELARLEPDVELEREMLDALDQLRIVQAGVAAGRLPEVETRHRVIGTDTCHFSAPASLPSDPSQPSGRVLLTGSRAVFVGAGRTSATAWHMVRDVARTERDVFLVRADGSPAAHFRFNTFGDGVVCAFLAAHLKSERRPRL
jgi:hypothetical protein